MSKVSDRNDGAEKRKDEHSKASPAPDEAVEQVEVEEEEELLEDGEPMEVEEYIRKLESDNCGLLDNLRRLQAEFDNYRKRVLRERARTIETAEASLAKNLLPVIDNLERALVSTVESDCSDTSGIVEGVAKVLDLLLDTLRKEGLQSINPEGEPFNPEYHEAMATVENDDLPEDHVVDVFQKGYTFAGALLRPAMVRVARPSGKQ